MTIKIYSDSNEQKELQSYLVYSFRDCMYTKYSCVNAGVCSTLQNPLLIIMSQFVYCIVYTCVSWNNTYILQTDTDLVFL